MDNGVTRPRLRKFLSWNRHRLCPLSTEEGWQRQAWWSLSHTPGNQAAGTWSCPVQPSAQRGLPVRSSIWAASWWGSSRPALLAPKGCFSHTHFLTLELDPLQGVTQTQRHGTRLRGRAVSVSYSDTGSLGDSWSMQSFLTVSWEGLWPPGPKDVSIFAKSAFLFLRIRVWSAARWKVIISLQGETWDWRESRWKVHSPAVGRLSDSLGGFDTPPGSQSNSEGVSTFFPPSLPPFLPPFVLPGLCIFRAYSDHPVISACSSSLLEMGKHGNHLSFTEWSKRAKNGE